MRSPRVMGIRRPDMVPVPDDTRQAWQRKRLALGLKYVDLEPVAQLEQRAIGAIFSGEKVTTNQGTIDRLNAWLEGQ